jgi:hypothetical protein
VTTWRALCRTLACGVGLACALARPASAQTTPVVTIVFPPGDTLRSVTPTIVVSTTGFGASDMLRVRLQLDTTGTFTSVLEMDTTVVVPGGDAAIAPSRALSQNARIFARATVVDPASGRQFQSAITRGGVSPFWVTLVTPPTVIGQTVRTRTPRFIWHSPQVNEPPGPWTYTITISNRGQPIFGAVVGSDTSYVPPSDLEVSAVYSWTVAAALQRTVQFTVAGPRTFVVEDPMQSVATTDMFPAFPNPFPGAGDRPFTCIWFDLRNASAVQLDVFDLRGLHVRRIVPNNDVLGPLQPGRYGRARTELNEGCDQRFAWDGTDDRGVYVPEGVYLVRFKADGVQRVRKVLFRGPH